MNAVFRFGLASFCSLALALASTAVRSAGPERVDGNVLAEFDVFNDGDVLLLPVVIEGQKYQFFVATAQPYSVFDEQIIPKAPIWQGETTPDQPDGNGATLYESPAFSIGPFEVSGGSPSLRADLSSMREAAGHAFHGVLGNDVLARHVIQIDSAAGKLRFLEQADHVSGERMPMTMQGGSPFIDLRLPDGITVEAKVDTATAGCCSVLLDIDHFQRLFKLGMVTDLRRSVARQLGAGDRITGDGRLQSIGIGKLNVDQLLAVPHPGNTVGVSFLMHFNAVFDFPDNRLILLPRSGPLYSDCRNLAGMGILRTEDGKDFVRYTVDGGLAEKSGIKPDDMLCRVNDKPAEEYRLHQIRRLLGGDAAEIRLQMQRGDEKFDVALTLTPNEK